MGPWRRGAAGSTHLGHGPPLHGLRLRLAREAKPGAEQGRQHRGRRPLLRVCTDRGREIGDPRAAATRKGCLLEAVLKKIRNSRATSRWEEGLALGAEHVRRRPNREQRVRWCLPPLHAAFSLFFADADLNAEKWCLPAAAFTAPCTRPLLARRGRGATCGVRLDQPHVSYVTPTSAGLKCVSMSQVRC